MFTSNQRNWPSANANGILLTDPVAVSFNGDVLLLAREKGVPTNKLYYNVRHNDPDVVDGNMEYSGWYELDMSLASSEPGSPKAKVGVRVLGAGLVTVPPSAQTAQPTDLPFAAVSDDRYIYIFRPSPQGTLYLDRFILLQVPAPQEDNNKVRRDSSKPKPTRYRMDRIWELRYRVSGEKDTPADERDMLGFRDMLGNPFIEPSLELAEVPRCLDGRFAITLIPTSEVGQSRWCYFAVIENQIKMASWPQSDDGLFDFLPDFWSDAPPSSFTIASTYVDGQQLTCVAGVGVRVYAEQDPIKNGAKLRRSMRLMLTLPVSVDALGIARAMAVLDFNILPSGYLPMPSSPLKCAFLDGQLVNGKFEPTTPLPALFPVTQSVVTLAYNSTIYSYLLGSVQPAATPFVLDGGDGLVHCYYGAFSAGDFHHFMVAQYSSEVTRPVIPLHWVAGDQSGNLDLVALRPGTSLNQIKVTLADGASADLCNMTVDYDAAVSGIGTESWVGLPRSLGSLTDVLNGKATGELLAQQVQDGSIQYFDYDGRRKQVRLPLTSNSQPTGWLTLVSTRQDLSLDEVQVSAPADDKVTVVITLKQGTNSVTQTWSDLPVAAVDLRTVLRGDAASYSYQPKSSDHWALGLSAADGTATMLFYAAAAAPVDTTSITIEQGSTVDKINLTLKSGLLPNAWTGTDLPANSQELAKALLAIPEVTTVFPVISAGDNGGRVAPQQSVQPLNLRTLSLLFSTLPPTDTAPVTQCDISASVLQGHSQSAPQTTTPLLNRLVALSALAVQVPNNGITAILANQTAAADRAESNGAWVSAKPLYELALPGDTAMLVPPASANFDFMAPSKSFTMETWLRPNGGTAPARVFSFNGTQSGKTPDWKVAPNFFLSVFAQPALQFSVLKSASSRPSFGLIQPNEFFTPARAFTFEIWIKPTSPISPQGVRGSLLQLLDPNNPSPCTMEISLDANLKPVVTFSDGSKNPIQTADTALRPNVWTHIAVTGEQSDPQNQLWKVSLYVNGQETSIKDQQFKIVWQRAGLNSFVVGGMGNANNPTGAVAMAETRYWQIRRTRTDIQDSLYYTLAGTEPGLVGYWPLSKGITLENLCDYGGPHLSGIVDVSTQQPIVTDSDGTFLAMAAGIGGAPALKANAFLRATHWNHVAVSYQAGSAVNLDPARHDLLVCKHDASLNLTDTFSIEAWIQVNASSQPLPQTFVAKWGKDATQQSYWLGLNAQGQLNLQAQYEYKRGVEDKQLQLVSAVPDAVTNLRDGKPHHVAATTQVTTDYDKDNHQTNLWITVTLFVDGKLVGMPVTKIPNLLSVKLQATTVDLTLGAAVPSAPGVAADTAPEAQMYMAGMLTGVVLWSHAIDSKAIATSIQKRIAMQRDGAVAAWWFLEQAGVDAVDSIGGLVAKLSSNDLWAVYNRLSELLFYSNGRRLLSIEPATDVSVLKGYPGGPTQFTLGGYQNGTALEDSLHSDFNEVRLWQQVRAQKQIADMRFTRLVGDESGLVAYWNFDDRSLNDVSPFGNNGAMWNNSTPSLPASDAPVSNEGPTVLNVYGGQPTEFQQELSGTPAVIEFSEVSYVASSPLDPPRTDGQTPKLIGTLSRAYYYTSATVNLTPGFYAGSLRMVYLGQVQTDATLLGFIEGAPPLPSENLTRPYYGSSTGYFSYFNASSINLSESEATTLTYNTSYGHSGTLDHTTSGGFRLKTKMDVTLGPLPPLEWRMADVEFKIGVKEKGGFSDQNVTIENSTSSWTALTNDSLSLRGNWETDDPEKFVNPQVGRRFLPDNVGYALVSSLTADVYLTYNAATGAAVGRAVVPNPDIPPDNNILTFQIDNTYIKNGTLDGKVGLYNDPDYPNANDVRGSYFKPIEAYRLKRQIAKKAADEERYFEQFDAYKRALGSDTSLSDQEPNRLVQRSSQGIIARKGMANTYVWTAAGGLHSEQEQFTDQYTTTFTGGYSVNNQFGIVSDFTAVASGTPPMFGGFFAVDWMGGFKIDISVTKTRTKNSVFGLNVLVTGEPALLTWDQKNSRYLAKPTAGKVAAYRFLTLYLPPDSDNGKTLMDQIVDRNWLRSNAADAVTLRSARVSNPAWRVLYRVTYVNRIPPDLDNTPNQTLPAPIPRLVDLENNEVLVALILGVLGAQQPTPANVGVAVAAVINPPGQGGAYPPSKLGTLVPWWDTFLATTRGPNRNQANYELLQKIQLNILQYVLAGFDQADVSNSSKTFTGVTEAIFNTVKDRSHARFGTVYDPATGNKGIATTETNVGNVVLGFNLVVASQAIQFWIISKPWIVQATEIFDGIATLIKDSQQQPK